MGRSRLIAGFLMVALTGTSWTHLQAQQRIPGWGRVAQAGGHQNDLALLRPRGGPVVTIFEGWYVNPDGTRQLCFGYFNTNTEEVVEIPIGPDNFIEPEEFNGLQPTHFDPVPQGGRRHWCILSVTVPQDWGDRDVIWTLRDRGQSFTSPGRTRFETYHLEEPVHPSRSRSAPKVRMDPAGPEVMGRTPMMVGPFEVEVGDVLPLPIWVRRDNPFSAHAFFGDGATENEPISFTWYKYQGPGDVKFEVMGSHRRVARRTLIEAETWMEAPDAWGQATTEATFGEAGEYKLLLQAYNDSGGRTETRDLEFFCCWTNLIADVTVVAAP